VTAADSVGPARLLIYASGVARWAVVALITLAGIAGVSLGVILRQSGGASPARAQAPAASGAAATWAAGKQRAPDFNLRDEHGKPISLASLRGRTVLLTFIDPLCRDFCPVEAQRLSDAVRATTGAKPTIVAVSVNAFGNRPGILKVDERKWNVVPQWRWAVGKAAELARVWRAYHVAVMTTTKTIAGVRVVNVVHTEGSYLIDGNGYERALFLWPYTADAVKTALRATPP
jgi:cytochrome oxidase Cu insertion factor (SCO1/SenC/PrrC family)